MTLGAAGYLTKPIDRDRLIALLRPFQARVPTEHASSWSKTILLNAISIRIRAWSRSNGLLTEADNGRVALSRLTEETARHYFDRPDDAGDGRIPADNGLTVSSRTGVASP